MKILEGGTTKNTECSRVTTTGLEIQHLVQQCPLYINEERRRKYYDVVGGSAGF